jgi:predicted metal-binding membrane protein
VAPALLLLAGLFQFSALKYRCLEKCRSPLSVVLSYWQGRRQRWQAFRLGWASGVFCVGCCWALMLLMLLTSVSHLAWMLVLAVVMAVEKNVRWGRRLSAPLGVGLMVCAAVIFVAGGDHGLLSRMAQELCGSR